MSIYPRGSTGAQDAGASSSHSSFEIIHRPLSGHPAGAAAMFAALWLVLTALPGLAPGRALPFTSARDRLTTAPHPIYQIIEADFNRDGWPDLLIRDIKSQSPSGEAGRVSVALHRQTDPPAYQEVVVFEDTTAVVGAVEAADLDGDGDLDVLYNSNTPEDKAVVWAENADGSGTVWTPRDTIHVFYNRIQTIHAGDFDQDGDPDIIVNAASNTVNHYWGWLENAASDGSVWEFRVVETGTVRDFETVALGDLDLNGALDIIVYSASSNINRVYWNNGAPSPVFTAQSLGVPHSFGVFRLGDVWGDRRPEIFRLNNLKTLYWYRYSEGQWLIETVADDVKSFGAVADLDFNGEPDLLGVLDNNPPVWFEYAAPGDDGPGVWSGNTVNSTSNNGSPLPVDVDRDGDLDWVHYYNASNQIGAYWFENLDPHKKAGFLPPRDINAAANGVRDVVAAHLNDDRWLDVAGAFFDGDNAQFHLGDGPDDWTFATGRIIGSGVPLDGAAALDAGRVDRDGRIDLVTAAAESGQVRFWQNMGTDNPTPFLGYLADSLEGAKDVALGDFDGDGDLDIAAVGRSCTADVIPVCTGSLVWIEQAGNPSTIGAWTRHLIQDTRTDYTLVATGDMDGDGDLDIVTAYRNVTPPPVQIASHGIQWFENDGATPPTFTPRSIASTVAGSSVQALRVVDMDGDADLDVLAADFTGNGARWIENTAGDGSAWMAHPIADGFDAVRAVDAADVDQDGDMDVLVASLNDNRLVVLENDGGLWVSLMDYDLLTGPRAARFADLNKDGALDILAGFEGSNKIVWFPGTVGSFTLMSYDIAPAVAGEGSEVPVLRAELLNWARTGEAAIIPNTIMLIVKNQDGAILTGAQIKTILSHVDLYADTNGDDVFDAGDTRVVQIPGSLLPDSAPGVLLDFSTDTAVQLALVPPGEARSFFGAVGIQTGAASTPITHFSIEMVDMDVEEAVAYPRGPGVLRKRMVEREATKQIVLQDVVFILDGWLLR